MISEGKIITQAEKQTTSTAEADLSALLIELNEQYRNVFMANIDGNLFIYRSLGRSEYKEIMQNTEIDDFTKEDVICDVCTLFPQNFDFANCAAGIPGQLTEQIIKNSLLDSMATRKNILIYYRQEMYSLDEQISCLIHEAFPRFDIEEIEAWDVERTTKYLSRAEWILQNLRGVPFTDYLDLFEDPDENADMMPPDESEAPVAQQEAPQPKNGRRKLTPEQERELAELKRKIPEIDWDNDSIMTGQIMKEGVNTISPALRTPDMMPDGAR